ncbi:hypothetical protein ACFX2G_025910 [Malus domestica]
MDVKMRDLRHGMDLPLNARSPKHRNWFFSIQNTTAYHPTPHLRCNSSAQGCTTHPICTCFCPPSWDPSISDYECTVKRQYCNLARRLELADSLSLAVKSVRHSLGSFIFPGA